MEYEEIIQKFVRSNLRRRMIGKLYVAIKDDTLIVHIQNNGYDYQEEVKELAIKVVTGAFNSSDFCERFVRSYKHYLCDKVLADNLNLC